MISAVLTLDLEFRWIPSLVYSTRGSNHGRRTKSLVSGCHAHCSVLMPNETGYNRTGVRSIRVDKYSILSDFIFRIVSPCRRDARTLFDTNSDASDKHYLIPYLSGSLQQFACLVY